MKHIPKAWGIAVIALLIGAPLLAQTSGRIVGTVTDKSGAAVPGAVVSASSPALQGVQTTTTDSKGEYRFLSVPPGTYTIKLALSGFKSVERSGVVVGLDRTVDVPVLLEVATVSETINVSGESPAIDTSSTTTGVNATADLFNRLPIQRDIYAIARVAPGTQNDNSGTVFYGSTGAENNYIIEGLNTTGIQVGTEGKTLNFDFVEEIEVKTGGLPAEYGRMTGGDHERAHEVGRQPVQGLRLRLLRGRRPAGQRQHHQPATRDDHPAEQHQGPVGLRRRASAATS